MEKKYIVRLTEEERETLRGVIKKFKGSSEQVRRAYMLFKADVHGPHWTDKKIAEALSCRTQTVENVRQRLVTEGFEIALCGKKHLIPPRQKRLDGEQEAKVIALRLSKPPHREIGDVAALAALLTYTPATISGASPRRPRPSMGRRTATATRMISRAG